MIEAHKQATNKISSRGVPSFHAKEGKICESVEPMPSLEDYDNLDFKQMLAICPLDGIELTRIREFPRGSEFDPAD